MNTEKTTAVVKNRFQFQGVEPNADLERKANLKLIQMLAYAPPGAVAVGTVQKTGNSYAAAIEVSSAFRTFTSSAFGLSLEAAVNRVLSKMDDQLYNWRFGRGGGQAAKQTGYGDLNNSPMAG